MPIELKIPEVGESITEAVIGKWLKAAGDHVEKDEPLVELETDKATMELPAPQAGRLTKQLKNQGDTAQVGDVIGYLDESDAGAKASASKDKEPSAEKAAPKKPKEDRPPAGDKPVPPRVMPAAQRALAEKGLDASEVEPTGPGGRLLKEDVQRHGKTREDKPSPAPVAAREGDDDRAVELVPMTPIRKRIAEHLLEARNTTAMLTTFNEVDMSAVMSLRKRHQDAFKEKHGVKLGFMSFFVKAAIHALRTFPVVNAMVREESIAYHHYYDIGVAISTDRGLIVPVLRDADRMSFAQVESVIEDFAARARDKKIRLDEIQGGTFTITNGGVFGSLLSTPILNAPQSGVLGMHTIQQRPVAVDGQVVIRPMMYLALTYDHRLIDGREAVQFLKTIKDVIEDPARLLVEV